MDSHVIPDFQFRALKGDDGYFLVLSSDPGKKPFKQQKGVTENLLCHECDNEILSRYEDHMKRVLYGGHSLDGKQIDGYLLVEGYDYRLLKNALLSILWRMSISSHRYFSEVKLGEKHEERLREGLLNNLEFGEEAYPIILIVPVFNGKELGRWSLPPDVAPIDGNRAYRSLISGLLFTFIVGSAPISEETRKHALGRARWPIARVKVEEIPFLYDACLRIGEAMAKREGI